MTSRSRYDDEEQPRAKRSAVKPLMPADVEDATDLEVADLSLDDDNAEPIVVAPAPAPAKKVAARPAGTGGAKNGAARAGGTAQTTTARPATTPRPAARPSRVSKPVAAKQQQPATRSKYLLPLAISAGLILIVLVVLATAMNSSSGGVLPTVAPQTGFVVATVNAAPIYQREFDERVARDRDAMINDPLSAALLNNFEGITGTRALEVVRYDALDKLINMEVIRQEAKKEGVWPSADDQSKFIAQAKQSDLAATNESFADFLKRNNIAEDQYNNSVVTNVVYTVVASRHLPKTGTPDERTNSFINWICTTRKSYNVNIVIAFTGTNNSPCTSGLPSDIPITEMPIPGAQPTAADGSIVIPTATLPEGEPTTGVEIQGIPTPKE